MSDAHRILTEQFGYSTSGPARQGVIAALSATARGPPYFNRWQVVVL